MRWFLPVSLLLAACGPMDDLGEVDAGEVDAGEVDAGFIVQPTGTPTCEGEWIAQWVQHGAGMRLVHVCKERPTD